MSTGHATITRLGMGDLPWRWAMRIVTADAGAFQGVIDTIKSDIPGRARKWDGEGKRWLFQTDEAIDYVATILSLHGFEYEHVRDVATMVCMTTQAAYEALHLLPTAPPELVTAAYRTLAKLAHPDVGGDDVAMTRLNVAVDVLRGD